MIETKMTLLLLNCLLFCLIGTFSLQGQADPGITKNTSKAVSDLAQSLTVELDSELEKASAFYTWIVENIRYDCKKYHTGSKRTTFIGTSEEDLDRQVKSWRKKQIEKTIKYQKGVCEDYSYLFKALCDEVGLESEVVVGDARDFNHPYRNRQTNPHAWNAVKIDGEWYLLDATWGAGYTDAKVSKFTRRVSYRYFMTPADWFAQNHFPEEEKWQLLEEPISKGIFSRQPLINYGSNEYAITDFAEKVKRLSSKVSEVWISFKEAPTVLMVTTRKGKIIKFERKEKEGKTYLTLYNSKLKAIEIYGGQSSRNKLGWLASYEI